MKPAALVILGLVSLLFAAPGHAARQTEGLCANVLIPQMEQAGLSTDMYGAVLGCELESGNWVERTVSQSQNGHWPVPLDARGLSLMTDVDDLSVDDTFAYSVRFDRNTSEIVTVGAGGKLNRTDIADRLVSTGPNWLNNYQDSYSEHMEVYLMNTAGQKPDLVEYLYWFMTRRDAVLQTMSSGQNPMVSAAFLANWKYMQWPWPWELADPITIAHYLATTTPSAPEPVNPQPTTSPPSQQDLQLTPAQLTAQPGETVIVQIAFPRLQGIHEVAFMAYAEGMWIENLPRAYIDTEGTFACSPGSDGDVVRPQDRAIDLALTPDYPPSFLELTILEGVARSGDRLSVCIEMVGFTLDREVFFWNARMDVLVVT